jgi:hypothetical protein
VLTRKRYVNMVARVGVAFMLVKVSAGPHVWQMRLPSLARELPQKRAKRCNSIWLVANTSELAAVSAEVAF